ncbi:MAG: hypothetical protein H0X64_08475 [Gemmatimonadaceae bacterium]|nr:hypothetical protein [Gemmatimonadaceae bacterium]
MTAAERVLWQRVQRRAAQFEPELARAILAAFAVIRERLTEAELEQAIALGGVERLVGQVMEQAARDVVYRPIRERMRANLAQGVKYFARDLPRAGRIDGVLSVGFDVLNPRMIDAVRALETRVITNMREGIRDTVRAHVENALRDGASARTAARQLRDVIGLAPNQEEAVRNFRRALAGADGARNPLDYKLRDRRFDGSIAKGNLTPAQIDAQVEAYRRRMLAFNATTNAKTVAMDTQRLAQRLSWEDAIAKGIVEEGDLQKTWRGTMDDRERAEHVAMERETVGFSQPFSNGQMIPGDSDYNCRCLAIYGLAPRR